MQVIIDFETASASDLKAVGGWKYAECPTTEIICVSYQIERRPIITVPANALATHEELHELAAHPSAIFIAHNTPFEKAIWRHLMVPFYDYADIPNDRWRDTMAVCAMKALPLSLDRVATVLRLPFQKDKEGSKLTIGLSKPNKQGYYDRSPETLGRVYKYCASDIRAERALHEKIGDLQSSELAVWQLDQTINERGLGVDLDLVDAMIKIVNDATEPMTEEFRAITGVNPGQRDKVLAWVRGRGVEIDNLRKETIEEILGAEEDDVTEVEREKARQNKVVLSVPQDVRRALAIRSSVGSASVKKLGAIRQQSMSDQRVRGLLQYHGAGPGRWTGRLFQPHNFPRGTLKVSEAPVPPDQLAAALLSGDYQLVQALFGDAMEACVSGLRHTIMAAPGHTLAAGDYSSIEARTVLALAGQHDKCAILAEGQDIYIDMAEAIFRKKGLNKIQHAAERTIGKFSVLGCGFGMGWKTFQEKYAPDRDEKFCRQCIDAYRRDFAPGVPELWRALEQASTRAVVDRKPVETHGVTYFHEDMWLVARIPSGRKIYYANPKVTKRAMPWSDDDNPDIRVSWSCEAWKNGRWIERDMYGGLLTQNVVEALARDVMVQGMFNCEEYGYPVVMTVHDEIITEPLTQNANADTLRELMINTPKWARDLGIPVEVETWVGERYRK